MAFKVHPFLEYRTFVQARKVAVEWVNPIPKGSSLRWPSFLLFFLPFSWERETSRGMTWTRLFEARELNGVLLQEIRDDVLERSVVYIG